MCPREACDRLLTTETCSVPSITPTAPETPSPRPPLPWVPCVLFSFSSFSISSSRKPLLTPRTRDPSLGFSNDEIFTCAHVCPCPPLLPQAVMGLVVARSGPRPSVDGHQAFAERDVLCSTKDGQRRQRGKQPLQEGSNPGHQVRRKQDLQILPATVQKQPGLFIVRKPSASCI